MDYELILITVLGVAIVANVTLMLAALPRLRQRGPGARRGDGGSARAFHPNSSVRPAVAPRSAARIRPLARLRHGRSWPG